jgi:signal transduction histidine kinase/DNA-binding NarL/FixJ family response regulator/HAMP domain-containing protein
VKGFSLSTRLTFAFVALVVATAGTVGYLSYRNIAAIAVPRALVRLDTHAHTVAAGLGSMISNARADLKGFRNAVGVEEIITLSRAPPEQSIGGMTLQQWCARLARWFAAKLEAKPDYVQIRLIGVADQGRELIRAQRAADGSATVTPDTQLLQQAHRAYFQNTIAAAADEILVSPVELQRESHLAGTAPPLPAIRLNTPLRADDGTLFGLLEINVDLRAAFRRIDDAPNSEFTIYVVNENGDYLVHPDPEREFGFARGTPFRIQQDFPEFASAISTGSNEPGVIENRAGEPFGVALAPVQLGGGRQLLVVATIPQETIVAVALTALRNSSLLGGAIAALCAVLIAFVLARTLARPVAQMTAAVSSFAQDANLGVPVNAGGEIGVLASAFDRMVREVREKNAAILHDKEIFEGIMAVMSEAVLLIDADGGVVYANPANLRLLGPIDLTDPQWRDPYEIREVDGITPLPRDRWPSTRSLRGEEVDDYELIYYRTDTGKSIHAMGSAHPIRNADGKVTGAVVVYRDVTTAKETERLLLQSQRLDAVGQLTGGVAHDFNNTLTVITGTAEILIGNLADRPELQRIAKLIDEAASRGAELTKHLLAFARRQPLNPRNIDVNSLVLDTARLLRSTLGEHIEIEAMLGNDTEPAHIDLSQLSSALLNLAVNARDAMADGGKLTFETGNVVLDDVYAQNNPGVHPGAYVMIAVSDTGSGIPAAVQDKVFEPFFTTKEVGRGTGLGLSMVYGFIKQSGGHIKVYSEEGHGTTIKLYLPRAAAKAEEYATTEPIEGGNETILVVEDDAMVRRFVVAQLTALGYRALTANSGAAALAIVDAGTDFDLLFTDVIMPGGINGRQLADAVRERRPGLKVLFTSGYSENAIIHHGRLDSGVLLLQKPYRKSELARMVRAALEKTSAPETPPPRVAAADHDEPAIRHKPSGPRSRTA